MSIRCHAVIYPIQFAISESKIVKTIPNKDRDFSYITPLNTRTYIYDDETKYYRGYQRSYFAVTCKKGGWDCMRHYEILANGCIPYFINLERCPENTMCFLPMDLILEAMHLPGVSNGKIDHRVFDKEKYYEILGKLLEHTRKYLSTKHMSEYVLRTVNYKGSGKILYLSNRVSPDYLRDCILIGLKELFSDRIVDFPKIDFIYKSYRQNIKRLYGKGFSYSKILDDVHVDRRNIRDRIKNKEFDLVIYGSVHRGLLFHDLVKSVYDPNQIVYLCGEDLHRCKYLHLPQLFLREF